MMNNNQYDEIKDLLKRSRLLTEQSISAVNIGSDIEDKIDQDEQKTPKDQYKKYRVEVRNSAGGEYPNDIKFSLR